MFVSCTIYPDLSQILQFGTFPFFVLSILRKVASTLHLQLCFTYYFSEALINYILGLPTNIDFIAPYLPHCTKEAILLPIPSITTLCTASDYLLDIVLLVNLMVFQSLKDSNTGQYLQSKRFIMWLLVRVNTIGLLIFQRVCEWYTGTGY